MRALVRVVAIAPWLPENGHLLLTAAECKWSISKCPWPKSPEEQRPLLTSIPSLLRQAAVLRHNPNSSYSRSDEVTGPRLALTAMHASLYTFTLSSAKHHMPSNNLENHLQRPFLFAFGQSIGLTSTNFTYRLALLVGWLVHLQENHLETFNSHYN